MRRGSDDPGSEHYTLVMPFVICRDRGGPFDADSFAAGWACAVIDVRLLGESDSTIEVPVLRTVVPQLDLVAMRRGWRLSTEGLDDEWVLATFTRLGVAERDVRTLIDG